MCQAGFATVRADELAGLVLGCSFGSAMTTDNDEAAGHRRRLVYFLSQFHSAQHRWDIAPNDAERYHAALERLRALEVVEMELAAVGDIPGLDAAWETVRAFREKHGRGPGAGI